MKNAIVAKEKDIKAALIDWLYARGLVSDAVIVNEMTVASWSRRADIALANGKLHAFEIKSQVDSLKRLDGQIQSFAEHFDKVTVVAASKFIPEIMQEYPAEIGVLEVIAENGSISLKQVRPGRVSEVRSVKLLSTFITKSEISRLLKQNGINLPVDSSRQQLEGALVSVPVKRLRAFVLESIKKKYRETHDAFEASRWVHGTYASLAQLSRKEMLLRSWRRNDVEFSTPDLSRKVTAREVDVDRLQKLYGDMPESMPHVVLRRLRVK